MRYLVWLFTLALYLPLFKKLYQPVLNGLTISPSAFVNGFSMPWGRVDDYTHAYFILPLSIWLVWRKRKTLTELLQRRGSKQEKNIFSFFTLLLGISMLLFGIRQEYLFVSTLSLIPFLLGLTGFLYGTSILKVLLFPILYLLFLVPPPAAILDSITLPMRNAISAATEAILALLNFPITRDGLLLKIGYNDIFMGQPCSGFRSLVTMFALVLVYVYINKSGLKQKAILATSIIPIAMLGNLIRVITLCLITFYFGEAAGQGFFHNFSGIVIFIITILGVMGIELTLDRFSAKHKSGKQNG